MPPMPPILPILPILPIPAVAVDVEGFAVEAVDIDMDIDVGIDIAIDVEDEAISMTQIFPQAYQKAVAVTLFVGGD